MTRLFIARHGNTFEPGELPRRIGARTDLPLVASGIEQARALGRWLARRGIVFDRALAGPLGRARDTAAIILNATSSGPRLEIVDWLNEVDHGPDEDQPEAVVMARIGRPALAAWDENGTPPPDWIVDAPHRLANWRRLLAAPMADAILIVTSNGSGRFAALSHPELRPSGPLKLRTGAVAEILIDADRVALVGWDLRPD